MSAPRRLVFVGEVVVDVTTWVPALPARGGDVVADAAAITPGGGFNVMAAAARQGMPVVFAGRHGVGLAGDTVRRGLAAEGITVLREADPGADSGFVVTLVEADGERTFVTGPAALLGLGPGGLGEVPAVSGDVVYVSGYGLLAAQGPDLARWVTALDAGITVMADPGPLAADVPPALLDAFLARADWWSCNAREATQITGIADPGGAGTVLAGRRQADTVLAGRRQADTVLAGRRQAGGVVVRAGAAGCVLVGRGAGPARPQRIAAPVVEVVDTTGAGDTHVGVFLAALAEGCRPLEAARRATIAATISVTRRGPATAPGRDELARWIDERS